MRNKRVPLFLLILLLINNGLGLIGKDTERAEILKDISQSTSVSSVNTKKVRNIQNYSDIKIPTLKELKNTEPLNSDYLAGTINIPSINLSINIIEGTNHENLKYGATTGLSNQEMGKGNYVLFGHNMEIENVMFSDLKELKKSDEIILKDKKGQEYHYEVSSSQVVDKKAVEVIEESKEPIITLINCSSVDTEGKKVSPNNTPYRLVVIGKLVK